MEGDDDLHFLIHLIAHRQLGEDIEIFKYNGKDKLGKYLKAFSITPGFPILRGLVITRDADESEATALQSIQSSLRDCKLPEPQAPIVGTEGPIRISAFVFPGAGAIGMLEDSCLTAIGQDPTIPLAHEFIQRSLAVNARPPTAISKCRLHAYLATREEPGMPIGLASKAGYIPLGHDTFDGLAQAIANVR